MISLSGMIDVPGVQDGSSLRSLIEKPPVCGNSFSPLTGNLLTGFRLHTGPVLTYVTNIHTHTRRPLFTDFILFKCIILTVCASALSSSLNSTDWCIFNLQRRKASTSTDTIDHRTPYHQVSNIFYYNILLKGILEQELMTRLLYWAVALG